MTVLLVLGGLWLFTTLRANLLDSTEDRTELAARKVAADVAADQLTSHLPDPEGGVDSLVVLTPDGTALAGTDPDPAALSAGLAAFRPGPGHDSASRVETQAGRTDQRGVVSVVRAESPDGTRYVYARTELDDVDEAIRALSTALIAAGPLLVALSAASAWAAATLTLRPVTAIRTALASVTASALDRRVPTPPGGDEITALAQTVNSTLDRLEQSVTRQRQFVADASHELRNPIAALRAELEVAALEIREPHSAAAIERVLGDTLRLQRIAADLLLLARLDARAPHTEAPVDLALLAAEEHARRRSARVPIVVEANAPVLVHGDHSHLERLLANLVDNAQRYAASEVRITATTDPESGDALLEVQDDGPGIPAESAERVFERFARLHDDRNRAEGGTGLGLAIAREIAQSHGGSLHTRPSQHGARLVARFPRARSQPPTL